MPSSHYKRNRQASLIDKIYHIYDAMHSVNVSDDFTEEARGIIIEILHRELEFVRNGLATITSSFDGDDDDCDDISPQLPSHMNS